ncbi:MAG: magnesium and cobalt transport protein CorA [Gammaproteobacteria bacterium]|nr:magnesium and cobalt transport protein CorA [Gammaproteobacteria bacterium]
MIVNCVAYRAGKRVGDIPVDDISEALKEPDAFVWLGLHEPDTQLLRKVQEEFSLHDLAIEDALHAHQRPKLEAYADSIFIVVDTAQLVNDEVRFGETHLFVGPRFIVTIRHGSSVSYAPVRQKCELSPHRLSLGPGYALYSVLDFVVDNYQPVADRLQARFQELEQEIFEKSFDRDSIARLYKLKGELIKLRDAVGPINDISEHLIRFHDDIIRKELRHYFRDIEDHVTRITKAVDTIREMLTTAIQVNLALVTVGQNEVVKRLAGWGAILAIPTVVFSMYGMNFKVMPELNQWFGYPLVVGTTFVACTLLYRRLVRAGWI